MLYTRIYVLDTETDLNAPVPILGGLCLLRSMRAARLTRCATLVSLDAMLVRPLAAYRSDRLLAEEVIHFCRRPHCFCSQDILQRYLANKYMVKQVHIGSLDLQGIHSTLIWFR